MPRNKKEDEELVDVYDDSLIRVGVATRYEAHKKRSWHFNFNCWVVTHRRGGSVVFQVRSRVKATFPGLLDSTVGGHYRAGERSPDLVREVREEIGARVSSGDLIPLGRRVDVASYRGVSKREIAQVFLLPSDRPLARYRLDRSEIEGLVDVQIEEGLALFSGTRDSLEVRGIGWEESPGKWRGVDMRVGRESFVPKMDSYYPTMLIMARRLLDGEGYLSI